MSEFYKYIDASLSRNDLPKTKNFTKSHLGTLISFGFLITFLCVLIYTIINYPKSYQIAFHELFIEDKDKEPIITFGFRTSEENIINEIYDSNNQLLNNSILKICDENLNEIKNGSIDINNYSCFINHKFFVSNSTNHLIKFHLFFKNESYINDDDRIKFSIKFKEPTINHEKKNPFIYPEEIKELDYFYDIGYTTRYNEYVKIINYETIKEIFLFFESRNQVESKFLEDYVDSSKLKENKTNEFLGSFRLSLSKKKEMFIRTYPDIIAKIGGYISIFFTIAGLVYFFLVRYIDNIRIYDSIKNDIHKKELSRLINRDDNDNNVLKEYDNEICCCCFECCICYNSCYGKKEENAVLINNIQNENEIDYNIDIACEEKYHYFFYKLTRNCCKKKDEDKYDNNNDNINESCCIRCKSCCKSCLEKMCKCIGFTLDSIFSVFCFCRECNLKNFCKCLFSPCCCFCFPDWCNLCKDIFLCCTNNNRSNKKLRRIDEYLEQHSDAENYFELIINKEKLKQNIN